MSTPIPKEQLEKILEAARLAPSASNIQPWHFIVVTDPEKRNALSKNRFAKFLAEAPVVIVGCGDRKALAATALGLGTCWVGSFDEKKVKELLKIPEKFEVIALLAVGYPREKLDLSAKLLHLFRRRKKLEQIASLEEYGKSFNGK